MANATDASAIADDRATPNDDDDDVTSSMRALRVGDDGEDEDAPRRARTILCPVTERDDDANAVKWARDNLVDAKRGDCVHLLHILPRRTEAVAGYAYPMMGAPTRRACDELEDAERERKRLDRVRAKHWINAKFGRMLRESKTPYLVDLTCGSQGNAAVGELITAVAEAIDADVIVMATHNRGALARFFVGSVANFCLRNATMPVVLLRPGEYALDRKRGHHRVLIDRHD